MGPYPTRQEWRALTCRDRKTAQIWQMLLRRQDKCPIAFSHNILIVNSFKYLSLNSTLIDKKKKCNVCKYSNVSFSIPFRLAVYTNMKRLMFHSRRTDCGRHQLAMSLIIHVIQLYRVLSFLAIIQHFSFLAKLNTCCSLFGIEGKLKKISFSPKTYDSYHPP